MTAGGGGASQVPAGFTYLGQFVDHDLTFDKTDGHARRRTSRRRELLQGRSPSLDLDSLYGAGPQRPRLGEVLRGRRRPPEDRARRSRSAATPRKDGFDLPRGAGTTNAAKRKAVIPDSRNDENLAVAQTHLAFIRFHNRVVDTLPASMPPAQRFAQAREIVDQALPVDAPRTTTCRGSAHRACVNDVFTNGRKAFEVGAAPTDVPTMPIEFSVAAFRLGHSMVRQRLQLERALRQRQRHARPAVHVLRRPAATSAATRGCRATGSPTSGGSTTSRRPAATTSRSRRASSTARCGIDTPLVEPAARTCRRARSAGRRCRATTRAPTSRSAT